MRPDLNSILILIGILSGVLTISNYLWKITKFLGSKSKSVDTRIHALYEVLNIQSARLDDLAEHLTIPEATRGDFHRRKSLIKLENTAFKNYEDEHTGFD